MHRKPTGYLLVLGIVALLVVGVALVGCGGGDETTTTAAPTVTTATGADTTTAPSSDTTAAAGGTNVTGTKYTFAESNPVASNQHQMAFSYGKKEMCKLLGADFVTADANITPAKQVADIETFIQQKVDGISSLDPGPRRGHRRVQEGPGRRHQRSHREQPRRLRDHVSSSRSRT